MSRFPLTSAALRGLCLPTAVLCAVAVTARGGETAPPGGNPEEAAIRAAVESYVAAYNRGDAAAVAAHWSDSGEWIDPSGQRFQGREAIQREMAATLAENQGVKIEVIDPAIRLVSPDVALEEGTVRVSRPGEAPTEASYIAVHAKKNGQWKLESVREQGLPDARPEQRLKQLEWMVGEWVDESPDVLVEHRCRWSEDGHYLLGQFVVQWQGRPAMKGDVRIGWDPLTRQIKSWIFDSEGGYAEGFWTKVGAGWVVKTTGVRPDGTMASSTNTYQPLRKDRYQFTSANRIVSGEQEPDRTIIIVRKPPQPAR